MALTRDPRPFSRETLRVALARFALVVLCALPAWLLTRGAISGGPASNPYFVDGEGPLPWLFVARLVMEVGAPWAGGLAAGALGAVVLDQLLLAGAVRVLFPRRGPWDRPRLAPAVFREGLAHLGPLVRVVLLALLAGGVGIAALRGLSRWLHKTGVRAGWWSYTIDLTIPVAALASTGLWLALVAAAALWTRVIVVADGRRRARRAATVALGVFRRRPGRALFGPAAALLLAALVPAPVLAWWRLREPLGGAGVTLFTLLVLAALALQAWIWTRLVAAAVARYAAPEMEGLRYVPDAPFGLFRWLRREGRTAGAKSRAAPAEP
jgi:hypothetical protein